MSDTPFFKQWLPILAPMGRLTADVFTHIRQCTLSQVENCFGALFASEVLRPPRPGDKHRERPYMAQAAREHQVDLYRISFTGAMDAFRHCATAMVQAKSAKKRQQLWDDLLHTLADDLVPLRPGRRESRAVKRRPKPYPRLNMPRHQYRENGSLSHCI